MIPPTRSSKRVVVETVLEDDGIQEGNIYEGVEEALPSEDDVSSVGTEPGELGPTRLQLSLHCGSLYQPKKKQQEFVCFGKVGCRRVGHSQSKKGVEGIYQVEKDGRCFGAPSSSFITFSEHEKILEQNRINNKAAMEAMARGDSKTAAALFELSGRDEKTPAKERPDSFQGKIEQARARMAKAEDFLAGPKINSGSNAGPKETLGEGGTKRSPFNSPVPQAPPVDHFAALVPSSTNSTLDTNGSSFSKGSTGGNLSKAHFVNGPKMSSSLQAELTPLVNMFTSQMNTMQDNMLKLQEKISSMEVPEMQKVDEPKKKKKKHRKKKKKHYSSSSSSSSSSSESSAPDLKNHRHATKVYHAVANGRGGINNAYHSAEEALPLVVGIPGAQYQRFHDCNEAWRWVFSQDQRAQPATGPFESRGPAYPAQENTQGWCQPIGPVKHGHSLESFNAPVKAFHGPAPPPTLPTAVLGADPSMKKKDEAFGVNLNKDVGSVRKAFCPPGVNSQTMKDLCGSMLDVVNLPGKSTSASNEEVKVLTETLGEVLQQRAEASNQDIRQDLNWKNENRIALKRVTNAEDLREMVSDLKADREDAMNKVMNNTMTILSRYPWEEHVLDGWKTHGYITRMSRDSLDCYYLLLQRLQYVESSSGWREAKDELQFHVKKLSRIRGSATNREECMFKTYAYLRDGQAADWANPKLDRAKIESIQKELQGIRTQSSWLCPKCKQVIIHGPDVPCPFKEKSNKEAERLGKAMVKALEQN